jgi:PAS domain S-box-containing protein
MDWPLVSGLLVDHCERPLVVLDRLGQVRLLSPAMEKLLGWSRLEVEGQLFVELCVPPERASVTHKWLELATSGGMPEYQCEVQTRDGDKLLLQVEAYAVGRGREQALVMTVLAAVPVRTTEVEQRRDQDVDYEISTEQPAFGTLTKVSYIGTTVQDIGQGEGSRCFEYFRGRHSPCDDCPLLRPASEPWPRTLIRRRGSSPRTFEVITADFANAVNFKVSIRGVSETALAAINEAKLREIADRANLSERERSVLAYLVMGRSLDSISTILEISARTVKFHQKNVLDKLGADSRADLVRLIL